MVVCHVRVGLYRGPVEISQEETGILGAGTVTGLMVGQYGTGNTVEQRYGDGTVASGLEYRTVGMSCLEHGTESVPGRVVLDIVGLGEGLLEGYYPLIGRVIPVHEGTFRLLRCRRNISDHGIAVDIIVQNRDGTELCVARFEIDRHSQSCYGRIVGERSVKTAKAEFIAVIIYAVRTGFHTCAGCAVCRYLQIGDLGTFFHCQCEITCQSFILIAAYEAARPLGHGVSFAIEVQRSGVIARSPCKGLVRRGRIRCGDRGIIGFRLPIEGVVSGDRRERYRRHQKDKKQRCQFCHSFSIHFHFSDFHS